MPMHDHILHPTALDDGPLRNVTSNTKLRFDLCFYCIVHVQSPFDELWALRKLLI